MLNLNGLRWTLLVALIAVAVPSSFGQDGEDVLRLGQKDWGTTPRTLGLAGASAGGIADWGSAVTNPAALALMPISNVSGSLDLTSVQSNPETGSMARVTRFAPGHGAYVVRLPTVRGAMVLGIGAHRTTSLDRRLFASGIGQDRFSRLDLYESGYLGEVSAVGAFEVAPSVFLGASFNALFGQYAFSEFSVLDGVSSSWSLESNLRGFNMRAGVVAEAVDGLTIGFAAESPSWIFSEETVQVGGAPEFVNWTAQTPFRATAGVVYRIDRFLFATDLSFADWGQARLRPSNRYVEANLDIQQHFQEVVDIRVGGEYEFGLGALRAGYGLAMDPLRDDVETDRLRHTFGTGFSLYLQRGITLDLGVAYTQFDDQLFVADQLVSESVGAFRGLVGVQMNL